MLAVNRDQHWPLTAWLAMIILRFLHRLPSWHLAKGGGTRWCDRPAVRAGLNPNGDRSSGGQQPGASSFGRTGNSSGTGRDENDRGAQGSGAQVAGEDARQNQSASPSSPPPADLLAQPQMHPLPMSAWAPAATPLSRRSKRARPPSGYRNGACGAAGPSLSSSRPPPAAGLYRAGQRQARRAPHHRPCLALLRTYARNNSPTSAATSLTAPARTSRYPEASHPPVSWLGVHETGVTTSAWLSLGGDPRRLPGTWPRGSYRALVVRVGFIGVGRMGFHVREPRPGGLSGHRRGYAR